MKMFLFHAVICPCTSVDGDLNRFLVNPLGDSHKDFPCVLPLRILPKEFIPTCLVLPLCFDFCVVDF